MRRLLLLGLGAAFLALGFADSAAADDPGYRSKRTRAVGVRTTHRPAIVRRTFVPYVGYWRPPRPEPPSGPPGIATVYAYPYFVAPTPYLYPSPYAGYARHTPGYQYGIPRCECGTGFAPPHVPVWSGWGY